MFIRVKRSGPRQYLQVVHNQRVDGRVRQQVIATLGRLDLLRQAGHLDELARSCGKLSEKVAILSAMQSGRTEIVQRRRIGPGLVFGRLWREAGLPGIFRSLLKGRRFGFSVERAVFLTVLHRLFSPGSDRAAELWQEDYQLRERGKDQPLALHQLYRAMAWLGETLPGFEGQQGTLAGTPRCRKDQIEEALFEHRRDLFKGLELVFFDTTSIYFEGEGGDCLGEYGFSKDHRPDRRQMVVGVVMDSMGRPICCEMWPGNTADASTLIPVVDRLKKRFGIENICIVADRGMISEQTLEALGQGGPGAGRDARFILGVRMRNVKEVRKQVLSHRGKYRQVQGPRSKSKDPSPLMVKEVRLEGKRYIVCLNSEQARKDKADRQAILASLRDRVSQNPKNFVGNKGYRKYLKGGRDRFEIDREKLKAEARYDGKWVLQTDVDHLCAEEVALKYKQLWMVESIFRSTKSLLETRPVYHRCDEAIRGHVFCSFLALVLLKELTARLDARGWPGIEWARLRRDLDNFSQTTLATGDRRFILRDPPRHDAGKALQAAGVALGPSIELLHES